MVPVPHLWWGIEAAFKLIECVSKEQFLLYLFIPEGLSVEKPSRYSSSITHTHSHKGAHLF